MNDIKQQFQKVIKSKTIKEMFINIPWNFIYFLLYIPLFLMVVLPLWQLSEDFIDPIGQMAGFTNNVRIIHNISLSTGIISIIIAAAKFISEKKKPVKPFSSSGTPLFFGLLITLMLISTLSNGITEYVKYGDEYRGESLLFSIMYFLFYFTVSAIIKGKKQKAVLLYSYLISGIPLAICDYINTFVKPLEAFSLFSGRTAIFFHFNHYGYFLLLNVLISEVLFIKEKNLFLRIICIVSFILNTYTLIINDTLGCYLAAISALIFSVIVLSICEKKFSKSSVLMIIIFIVITLIRQQSYNSLEISLNDIHNTNIINGTVAEQTIPDTAESGENTDPETDATSIELRIALLRHTIEYIKEKPLLGFGQEGIHDRLLAEPDTDNSRPHCEFLQYAAFYGIPAAIAYICGVFCVFLNGLKKRYELDIYTIAALVASFGYLVSSALGNTTFYITPVFFILLGLAFNTRKTNE